MKNPAEVWRGFLFSALALRQARWRCARPCAVID
jgi:hypothetical protein